MRRTQNLQFKDSFIQTSRNASLKEDGIASHRSLSNKKKQIIDQQQGQAIPLFVSKIEKKDIINYQKVPFTSSVNPRQERESNNESIQAKLQSKRQIQFSSQGTRQQTPQIQSQSMNQLQIREQTPQKSLISGNVTQTTRLHTPQSSFQIMSKREDFPQTNQKNEKNNGTCNWTTRQHTPSLLSQNISFREQTPLKGQRGLQKNGNLMMFHIPQASSKLKSLSQFPQNSTNESNQFAGANKLSSQGYESYQASPLRSLNETQRQIELRTPFSTARKHNLQSINHLEQYQQITEIFSKKLNWIDQIESKNFNNQSQLDFSSLPQATKKLSSQPLQVLLSSKTIDSQQIYPMVPVILRCDINDFVYFKVSVFEQNSPLKLKFVSEINTSNIRLFVSKTCHQPNNFNCDYFFINTKTVAIEEERNLTRFRKKDFYYFSLVSAKGQDITMKVSFGQDRKVGESRQSIKNMQQQERSEFLQQRLSVLNLQNFEGKDDQEDEKEVCNLIQKNIEASSQITQFSRPLSILQKKQGNYQKILSVIEKAKQLKEARVEEIIRTEDEKIQKQIAKIMQFRKDFFVFFWSQTVISDVFYFIYILFEKIKLVNISTIINARFSEKKESIQYFAKIAWKALPLINKFRVYRSKYPDDLYLNRSRYARYAMETFAKMIKKNKKIAARELLGKVLIYNQYYSDVKSKMMRYYRVAVTMQTRYRQFRNKIVRFKELLLKLWDKYYFVVIEQFVEIKQGGESESQAWKKKQAILSQLNCKEAKNLGIEKYFMEILKEYKDNLLVYIEYVLKLTLEQKRIINVVEAFMNTKNKKKHHDIFKKFLDEKSSNFNVENVALSASTTAPTYKKDSFYHEQPKLFILPSLQQMHALIKQGIISYVQYSPDAQAKVNLKP